MGTPEVQQFYHPRKYWKQSQGWHGNLKHIWNIRKNRQHLQSFQHPINEWECSRKYVNILYIKSRMLLAHMENAQKFHQISEIYSILKMNANYHTQVT